MTEATTPPDCDRLRQLIEQLRDRPIVVVADLVADRFLSGWARRISREAPVLILEQESIELVPGGGANAIANVRSLGGSPRPIGVVGSDDSGHDLVADLAARGLLTEGITELAGHLTPTKTRVLGGSTAASRQQIVRIDSGDSFELEGATRERLLEAIGAALEGVPSATVVFSDYGYGVATPELCAAVQSRRADVQILVDSRYRLAEYQGIDAATPNQEEAEALVGSRLDEEDALLEHAPALRRRLDVDKLLITRGRRGMALILENGVAFIPIYGTDQVVDVTGAGDTVIGAFSLALAAGATGLEASLLANYAGGVAVMKAGTATVTATDLLDAVEADADLPERVRWRSF
ncbi:MAG: PfkB family carbohydrate kinase [Acidobacteriota bacterium]